MATAYVDTTVNVDITDGVASLAVGPETYTHDLSDLADSVNADHKQIDFLWHQIALRLIAGGTDVGDPGAVKQAIEGGTYKW